MYKFVQFVCLWKTVLATGHPWTFAEFHVSRLWPPPDSSIANHASDSQPKMKNLDFWKILVGGEGLLKCQSGLGVQLPYHIQNFNLNQSQYENLGFRNLCLGSVFKMPVWIRPETSICYITFRFITFKQLNLKSKFQSTFLCFWVSFKMPVGIGRASSIGNITFYPPT